jgi:hemerythrin-like domain-containing protein
LTASNGAYAHSRDMYAVHTVFRREFALMPALVRGVAAGDKERSQIVADHIKLVTTILHHHHQAEDVHLWPKLLQRGPDDVVPIVQLMESHHVHLAKICAEIESATGSFLAELLDRLNPPLNEHITLEERRILPFVDKYVTAAEWDLMIREGSAEVPREAYPLIFGMVLYEAEPEYMQHRFSRMPPEAAEATKRLASQAFASHSQRVYGTATPPRSQDVIARN